MTSRSYNRSNVSYQMVPGTPVLGRTKIQSAAESDTPSLLSYTLDNLFYASPASNGNISLLGTTQLTEADANISLASELEQNSLAARDSIPNLPTESPFATPFPQRQLNSSTPYHHAAPSTLQPITLRLDRSQHQSPNVSTNSVSENQVVPNRSFEKRKTKLKSRKKSLAFSPKQPKIPYFTPDDDDIFLESTTYSASPTSRASILTSKSLSLAVSLDTQEEDDIFA